MKENNFIEDISENIEQLYFLEKAILSRSRYTKLSAKVLFDVKSNGLLSREYLALLRRLRDVLNHNLSL